MYFFYNGWGGNHEIQMECSTSWVGVTLRRHRRRSSGSLGFFARVFKNGGWGIIYDRPIYRLGQ